MLRRPLLPSMARRQHSPSTRPMFPSGSSAKNSPCPHPYSYCLRLPVPPTASGISVTGRRLPPFSARVDPLPEILFIAAIISGIGGWAAYQIALFRAAGVVHQRLKDEGALLTLGSYNADCSIQTLGLTDKGWRHAVIALTAEGLIIYPRKRGMDEVYTVPHKGLRWF